jgi:hypothetical protein
VGRALAWLTCPISIAGRHPQGFYFVLVVNAATYALIGLVVEAIRAHHTRRLAGRVIGLGVLFIHAVAVGYGQAHGVLVQKQLYPDSGCPMVIKATYVPAARFLLVDPVAPGEQRWPLHVDFETRKGWIVVGALITVSGVSVEGSILPLKAEESMGSSEKKPASRPGPWLVQTFTIHTSASPQGMSGTVWLTGFGGIESVRVDSIYINGSGHSSPASVWVPPEKGACYAQKGGTEITSNQQPKSN